jgi:hypothetical protein
MLWAEEHEVVILKSGRVCQERRRIEIANFPSGRVIEAVPKGRCDDEVLTGIQDPH